MVIGAFNARNDLDSDKETIERGTTLLRTPIAKAKNDRLRWLVDWF